MNQLCEMIGLSFGEFQSWYYSGDIRLSSDRFVNIEISEDGTPVSGCSYIPCLFERLPDIGLDDEEGILLIQLNPIQSSDNVLRTNSIQTGIIFIPIERLMRVIPLSDRARRILTPRMDSFGIEISEPYFEDYARIAHCRMKVKDALRGGDALTNTLFTMEAGDIDDDVRSATKEGIARLEGKDNHPQEQRAFNWVIDAYSYTRKVPFKKGNIDYVIDSGVVLKTYCSRLNISDSLVKAYRETVKVITDGHEPSAPLCEILANLRAKQETQKSGDEFFNRSLASLISLSIFLYWKEVFHKNNNEIDYQGLIDDVIKFNNGIGFQSTLVAVWLLGNYAGFERIAPFVYHTNSDRYSWFSGPNRKIVKIANTETALQLTEKSQNLDIKGAYPVLEETKGKSHSILPSKETEDAAAKQQTDEDNISHFKEQPKPSPLVRQPSLEGIPNQDENEFASNSNEIKLGGKVRITGGKYKGEVGKIIKINKKSVRVEIDGYEEQNVTLKNLEGG
ncbi:MAG: hypothetical protein ACI9WC_001487 [Arenicella sp.]|jgi:hypothetical protein